MVDHLSIINTSYESGGIWKIQKISKMQGKIDVIKLECHLQGEGSVYTHTITADELIPEIRTIIGEDELNRNNVTVYQY